jgi:uncharacterized membrane protein YccC
MNETGGENQTQKVGIIVGILAALLVLRRLRKRRRAKKLLKAQAKAKAQARARVVEQRIKEEKTREKAGKKFGAVTGEKTRRNRSFFQQVIRIVILAFIRKFVLEQMGAAAKELNVSKLGKKVVEATES